jgi:AcrR family transcriptional regulator
MSMTAVLLILRQRSVWLNACRVKPVDNPTTRAARRAASARRIVDAAQFEFGEHGLEGATIRAIAHRAGVDPSLVIQHFGSKKDLFAIAVQHDSDAPDGDIAEHLVDVLRVRLNGLRPETRALMRSMLTAPVATAAMRDFLEERIANLARGRGRDADLRAAVVVSSILGLTIARHFLELDALTSITESEIDEIIGAWLAAGLGDPVIRPRS